MLQLLSIRFQVVLRFVTKSKFETSRKYTKCFRQLFLNFRPFRIFSVVKANATCTMFFTNTKMFPAKIYFVSSFVIDFETDSFKKDFLCYLFV